MFTFAVSLFFLIFSAHYRIKPIFLDANAPVSTDQGFHYYYINLIRANGHRPPIKNIMALGGKNDCSYPSFYHEILSYLPQQVVEKYAIYTSFVYDFLVASTLVLLITEQKTLSVSEIFLIFGIYFSFPSITFHSAGPRSFALTPRNFSQFLCALGYMSLIFANNSQSYLLLQLTAIFFAFAVLSSKFTLQLLFLQSIAFSILDQSWLAIGVLLNIMLYALLFKGKWLLTQVKGHLEHSWWQIKHRFYNDRYIFSHLFLPLFNRQWRKLWNVAIFHHPMTRGIILNLPIFLLLGDLTANYEHLSFIKTNKLQFLLALLGSFILPWLLTQFSFFRAFGEPERYIEFALPVFLFALFTSETEGSRLILVFCIFSNTFFMLYSSRVYKMTPLSRKGDLESLKNCVNEQKSDSFVLLCTVNTEAYLFISPNDKFVCGFFSNNKYTSFSNFFYDTYPNVNPNKLKEMCETYKVSHVLINKKKGKYDDYLPQGKIIYDDETYSLLKIDEK